MVPRYLEIQHILQERTGICFQLLLESTQILYLEKKKLYLQTYQAYSFQKLK